MRKARRLVLQSVVAGLMLAVTGSTVGLSAQAKKKHDTPAKSSSSTSKDSSSSSKTTSTKTDTKTPSKIPTKTDTKAPVDKSGGKTPSKSGK